MELQRHMSIEKKTAEGNASASCLENRFPPEGGEEEAERAAFSNFNNRKQKQPSNGKVT
jgi:hypothetical protein